jgi:hypothetical protein
MSEAPVRGMLVGDERAGYQILSALVSGSLRVQCWGYWCGEVAATFEVDVPEACRETPNLTHFVLDAEELKPQGAQGQVALRSLMSHLGSMKETACTVLSTNALTKMQLVRFAREYGVNVVGDD